ncbi:MAG: hypothetical protein B6241_00210 [Spirochaetaceae bacterium 4572_59]|nr:MAG: hypothetical protein B6241_00210 [Spirochaetaceae bacterium 4572_59]
MLLSKDIHSDVYLSRMMNLNKLRESPYIQNVYPEILQSCIYEKELKLIPLSLDLPLIIFNENSYSGESKYMSWEDLSESASSFNISNDGRLTNAGFSPQWSHDFIMDYLSTVNISFQDFMENSSEIYKKKTFELSSWNIENNQGTEEIKQFNSKYRYIPDYRLIISGRIGFSFLRLSDFMLLPDSITAELSSRIFSSDNHLRPRQIISTGVFMDPPNPKGVDALIKWLLQEKNWDSYIHNIIQNRDRIFGLDGISANYRINETILSKAYPTLKGKIPYPGEFGSIPAPLPQWEKVCDELIIPHAIKVLSAAAEAKSLTEEYRKWLLLNPDPLQELP